MNYIVVKDLDEKIQGRAPVKLEEDAEEAFFGFCEENSLYAKDCTFEIE